MSRTPRCPSMVEQELALGFIRAERVKRVARLLAKRLGAMGSAAEDIEDQRQVVAALYRAIDEVASKNSPE